MNLIIINKLNNSLYNTIALISSIKELNKDYEIIIISKKINDEVINKFNDKIKIYTYTKLDEILLKIISLYKTHHIHLIKDTCFILKNINSIIDANKININYIPEIKLNIKYKDFMNLVLKEVYEKHNTHVGDDFISANYYLWKYIISEYTSLLNSDIIDNDDNSLMLTLNYNYLSLSNLFNIFNSNIYSAKTAYNTYVYNDINNESMYKKLYPQQYEYQKDLLFDDLKDKKYYNKYISSKRYIVDNDKEYIRRIQCPHRLGNSSCEVINDILGWHHGMDIRDCDSCFNYGVNTIYSNTIRENYVTKMLNKIINNIQKGNDYDDNVIINVFLKHLSVKEAEDILLKVAPTMGKEISLKIAKKLDEKEDYNQEI